MGRINPQKAYLRDLGYYNAPMSDNTTNTVATSDRSRRFLFEQADIRGETIHLDKALTEALSLHRYPAAVSCLLGEFIAASGLLASNLKFQGKLSLQVRGDGQIPLLMAECTSNMQVRAIARDGHTATSEEFAELLGNGQLAITVDPVEGKRYQGIVPLAEDSLANSLQSYFTQSEQLQTRIWLACDGKCAAGMLLQQLPPTVSHDAQTRQQQWQHCCTLAATIGREELLDLPAESLLHRLFHQDSVRIFAPKQVEFACSCSRERTMKALTTLEPQELQEILTEQGAITMDCEFCNRQYVYQDTDLGHLLHENNLPTLH